MIGKKKKITKKEIKEDKLVSSFYEAQDFFEKNQQPIIISVVVIAVIILAFVWYTNKVESDNLQATAELSKIIPLYEQNNFEKAIEGEPGTQLVGLQELVNNYGSTEQGEAAKIYLANSYYATGDYENAKKYYSDYSGTSTVHKASSYAGLAACYEKENNWEEAAENYNKAANITSIDSQKANFLLNAGINYLKAGDLEDSKLVLETVKNDFKTTIASREVDKYLSQID